MTESSGDGGQEAGTGTECAGAAWSEADDAYLSAMHLAAWLRSGRALLPIQTFIALQPDEKVFYETGFAEYVFATATVRYGTGWVAMFGSPAWLAASLAGSAAYNNYQRNKAQTQAAAQWRLADQGVIHITSRRICLQGNLRWTDIPLADIRALDARPDGVVIHRLGQSPIKISTAAVAYLYVLMSFLLHGQAVDVPIPGDFAERAQKAGRVIPTTTPIVTPATGQPPIPQALRWVAAPGAPTVSAWNSPGPAKSKVDVLGRPYADWGTRAAGALIDLVVLMTGWAVLIAAIVFGASLQRPTDQYGDTSVSSTGVAIIVVSLLCLIAWTVGYHVLLGRDSGQTVGKRAVSIKVCDATTGGCIGYPRVLGRELAQIFAWMILPVLVFVDLLWPLWDDRLQTLHDKAVHSVVVKVTRPQP